MGFITQTAKLGEKARVDLLEYYRIDMGLRPCRHRVQITDEGGYHVSLTTKEARQLRDELIDMLAAVPDDEEV